MPGFNFGSGGRQEPPSTAETFRAHRWKIISLGADGSGPGLIAPDHLLFAKSVQLPGFSVEEEQVIGAAIKYKFAKTIAWEDVTVSFYDVIGLYSAILSWQDKVYTSGSGIKSANEYKKQSTFALTDGTGSVAGPTFTLMNSWPKNVTHSALSYDTSDIKLVNLVLSYDWAEIGTTTT